MRDGLSPNLDSVGSIAIFLILNFFIIRLYACQRGVHGDPGFFKLFRMKEKRERGALNVNKL